MRAQATHYSLRRQLLTVILATSALAVAAAGATLFVTEIVRARAATQKEMLSVATLIGNRSSAALLFQDERVALENLHALAGLDQIASACLFAERGALVAQFSSASAAPVHCLARQPIGRPFVQVGMLDAAVQLPVVANGNVVGAILINSAAAPLVQRLSAQFISLALALCGALLVAALLAVRLQRGISGRWRRCATSPMPSWPAATIRCARRSWAPASSRKWRRPSTACC